MRRTVKLAIMTLALVVATCLIAPPAKALAPAQQENITSGSMIADLFLIRPIGVVATAFGAVVFVASLPFTLTGNNVGQASKVLLEKPAEYTFKRPLGAF